MDVLPLCFKEKPAFFLVTLSDEVHVICALTYGSEPAVSRTIVATIMRGQAILVGSRPGGSPPQQNRTE